MQKAIGDSNEKPKLSEDEQNEIRVIGVVKAKAKDVEGTFDTVDAGINDARDELAEVRQKLEALRKARGAVPKESDTRSLIKVSPNPAQEEEPFPQTPLIPQAPLKSWKELEAEGRAAFPESVSWDLVLTPQEQARIEAELDALREAFDAKHRLDTIDWSIAYLAGICGGLIDWLLVKIPKTSNATNTPKLGEGEEGYLSKKIKAWLSEDNESYKKIAKWCEEHAKVSYDYTTAGTGGPRSHRLTSLGHDPIFGLIFGLVDIMAGKHTYISAKTGKIIIGKGACDPEILAAFWKPLVHLLSDIHTKAGLPCPGSFLTQLCNFGDIDGRTIAELARAMYQNGYDFRHYLAAGISTAITDVIVRLSYFGKRFGVEKLSFRESIPFNIMGSPYQPKLQTMLFTAHATATAFNALKVGFSKNPLAINLPQWQVFTMHVFRQVKWVASKESERNKAVCEHLDAEWANFENPLNLQTKEM